MKTSIIALSTAALIVGAPAGFAQGVPGKVPTAHHTISKQRHPSLSSYAVRREMEAKAWRKGSPNAFGYAPAGASGSNRDMTDISPYAGGGGGGGGPGGGGGGM